MSEPLRRRVRVVLPVLLRLTLLAAVGALVGIIWGPVPALSLIVVVLTVNIGFHVHYLSKLGAWLDRPSLDGIPDGVGAWSEVFARLYRARRSSERNERQLLENEERFRRTVSALPQGIVLIDPSLQIEWCNPVAEVHLGISLRADQGLRVTNLVRDPPFVAFMTSGKFDQTLTLRPLWNPALALQLTVVEFEPARSILITRDITHDQRIDAMRRDFVANVSHELRTPLTVIAGFLETLLDGQPTPEDVRRHHLDLMQEQAQRMNHLVEDLLMLSRLESEREAGTDRVDVPGLVLEVADEARALSQGRHAISVEKAGEHLLGSREELRSAFSNLVSNAIRYTPAGGRITLRWVVENGVASFEVEDTGIGIAAEHIPRLTERFYRVDKSRSRGTGGTGLGLAIVKHVLLRHDAFLDINSQIGRGSRFSARFPASRIGVARPPVALGERHAA